MGYIMPNFFSATRMAGIATIVMYRDMAIFSSSSLILLSNFKSSSLISLWMSAISYFVASSESTTSCICRTWRLCLLASEADCL